MRWTTLPVLVAMVIGSTAAAEAQPARPAAPRDVRDIFIALPLPQAGPNRPVLARVGTRLSTPARRRAALDSAVASENGVLDRRNGYLEMNLARPSGTNDMGLVLTYFTQANGSRLVVLKVESYDDGAVENYAWTLAGSTFTPRDLWSLMPPLTYADFWERPTPPRELVGRTLLQTGALRFSWPQQGTVATVYIENPFYGEGDDPRAHFFDQRSFQAMELAWDRQRGRFTKGQKFAYSPDEEEHHHH